MIFVFYGVLYIFFIFGVIVGIVFGFVVGFCLVFYLFYMCINIGNVDFIIEGMVLVVICKLYYYWVYLWGERRRMRDIEIMRMMREQFRGLVIVEEWMGGGMESVIFEERRRSYFRGGGGGVRRVVEVSDDDMGMVEDEVVVIEEYLLVRGGGRRRERSRIWSQERRSSGYREVDLERFVGGDVRVVEVRRLSSYRRQWVGGYDDDDDGWYIMVLYDDGLN